MDDPEVDAADFPITPRAYRRTLGGLPTSVVVVTGMIHGAPVGMVVGTFISISISPPLVGFFGDPSSSPFSELATCRALSINLLDQHDLATSEVFRHADGDPFAELMWTLSEHGTPHLASAMLVLDINECERTEVGVQQLLAGTVHNVAVHDPLARPLIFHGGRVMRLDSGQLLDPDTWQVGWEY